MQKNLHSLCSIRRHETPGNNLEELLQLQISHLDIFLHLRDLGGHVLTH